MSLEDAKDAPQNFYVDITINNAWINDVVAGFLDGSSISSITIPTGQSRRKLFVNAVPNPREVSRKDVELKLVDGKFNSKMKVDGKDRLRITYSDPMKHVVIDISESGNEKFFGIVNLV